MIKVVAPAMTCWVIDWAIQAFGGAGITGDFGLAAAYTTARYLACFVADDQTGMPDAAMERTKVIVMR